MGAGGLYALYAPVPSTTADSPEWMEGKTREQMGPEIQPAYRMAASQSGHSEPEARQLAPLTYLCLCPAPLPTCCSWPTPAPRPVS